MAKETIKVRVTATVEVDYVEWANLYGMAISEVRGDVKSYFANLIHQSPAQEAGVVVKVTMS